MDEMTSEQKDNPRVKTPMGNGEVVGLNHKSDRVIVNLDWKPVVTFDNGTNPLLVWSFDPKDVEVLNEK